MADGTEPTRRGASSRSHNPLARVPAANTIRLMTCTHIRPPRFAALIVAAGRGLRAGGGLPKQYREIGGRMVLRRTFEAFISHPQLDTALAVIHPDDLALYHQAAPNDPRVQSPAHGGDSRAASVLAGLRALAAYAPSHVLIHDGARPFLDPATIDAILDALGHAEGAVATLAAVDAMRGSTDGALGPAIPREGVQRMQTPQAFRFDAILAALEAAESAGALAALPDDVTAAMEAGLTVVAVPGDPRNIKLTTAEDFDMAENMLAGGVPRVRVGQGFDVHAFGDGDAVTLCGVSIPHSKGLSGHSDADVGLHALTDALLGAIASGDIGQHFPPSDPQWKGADSAIFLEHAVQLVGDAGYAISNADITLICERPKIGPHAAAMRARVAALCGLEIEAVSVKATTTERLGFCGREEGIAAMAGVCLIGVAG